METTSRHQFGSYDKKLISILEILGSHFVDVYYNHVYNSARTGLKSGGSLTDEYVRRVQSYIVGVKTDEQCYRQIVQNLHRYFQSATRYTTLSFVDFVERIVQQFIPSEYYNLLNSSEKDESLGSIIADIVSGLGAYVTSPDLIRRIIDEHDHNPRVTIRMIQDQGVTILLAKRGEIHNSFLRRIGQAKDTVSMDVVDGLKQVIRKLVKQKAELRTQLGETEEQVLELEDEIREYKKREGKFKKVIKLMQIEKDQGQPAAAYSMTVPPYNNHAELDPLDFSHCRPKIPHPDRIAEPVDGDASAISAGTQDANFFTTVTLPTTTAAPLATAPPKDYEGQMSDMHPPALTSMTRPSRRAPSISTFIADSTHDSSDEGD